MKVAVDKMMAARCRTCNRELPDSLDCCPVRVGATAAFDVADPRRLAHGGVGGGRNGQSE
jgi:hypothetical protein